MATTPQLDVVEVARQVAQDAAQAAQDAKQAAQQIAQDIAQSVQDVKTAAQAVQEAARGVGVEASVSTNETEVSPAGRRDAWAANFKRTYDDYLQASLTEIRRSQDHYDNVRAITQRMFQNAVDNDNLITKQAIRHADLSITREVLDVVALGKVVDNLKQQVEQISAKVK